MLFRLAAVDETQNEIKTIVGCCENQAFVHSRILHFRAENEISTNQ